MPFSFDKCLVIHYGLQNSHYNYNCGNYTSTNKNIFFDLGIVSSFGGTLGHIYGFNYTESPPAHWTIGFRGLVLRNSDFLVRVNKAHIHLTHFDI